MNIISDKIVTTRKEHRCDACCRKFEKGSQMRVQVNIFDGIGTYRTCIACADLIDLFGHLFDSDGFFYRECVQERINDDFPGMTPEDLLQTLKQLK